MIDAKIVMQLRQMTSAGMMDAKAALEETGGDLEKATEVLRKKGIVKKTPINAFLHFKNRPIIAINLDDGDSLRWVERTTGKQDVVLITSAGMVIRFNEVQVRTMGRASRGVKGIKVKAQDELVSMNILEPEDMSQFVLLITQKGYGKNLRISEFKTQNRGGIGVRSLRFRKKVAGDRVTATAIASKENEVMIVTKNGTMCRQKIEKISTQKRESQGVIILRVDGDDQVIAMSQVEKDDEESGKTS